MLQDVITIHDASADRLQALCHTFFLGRDLSAPWQETSSVVDEVIEEASSFLVPAQKGFAAFSI